MTEREHTLQMADAMPNAGLLILPEVSHFAFLQDAAQFDDVVLRFLAATPQKRIRTGTRQAGRITQCADVGLAPLLAPAHNPAVRPAG